MTSNNLATSNRWDTRTLVSMALLAAIGAALSFIEFPIGMQYLKYDASNVPAIVGGFVFGPGPGLLIGVVASMIHAIFVGDWIGCAYNIIAVAAAMLPAAIMYQRTRKLSTAIIGLIIGMVLATGLMVCINLVVFPAFYGYTTDQIVAMIMPLLVPFNLLKTGLNAVFTLLIYKPISKAVKPKKDYVKIPEAEGREASPAASGEDDEPVGAAK